MGLKMCEPDPSRLKKRRKVPQFLQEMRRRKKALPTEPESRSLAAAGLHDILVNGENSMMVEFESREEAEEHVQELKRVIYQMGIEHIVGVMDLSDEGVVVVNRIS